MIKLKDNLSLPTQAKLYVIIHSHRDVRIILPLPKLVPALTPLLSDFRKITRCFFKETCEKMGNIYQKKPLRFWPISRQLFFITRC